MSADAAAYLVVREDGGFGEVFPLAAGQRYSIGRVPSNQIVLRDELCSREHAEVFPANGRWRVRDNKSRNGTRVNGERLDSEWELSPGDEIQLGRSRLYFVKDMSQLPDLSVHTETAESVSIKKRLGNTRFLTPSLPAEDATVQGLDTLTPAPPEPRHRISRDLTLLYRLALDMGSAASYQEMVQRVLDAVLDAVPADAGAIMAVKEGRELELIAHRQRDGRPPGYVKISQYVSNEVMASKEAILAEDVSRDKHLQNRESLADLRATSLICAPVMFNDRLLGMIHLYCTDAYRALDAEDLEFTLAVAKQLGVVTHQLQKQDSLSAENEALRNQLGVESELVGESDVMGQVEEWVGRVAETSATVLIRGESGTGKELVARAIHFNSPRRKGAFVCLNCAALPETLMESELFGHEKGAFTGATEKKIGKFEAADGGTIFLDEIGEMTPTSQAKLLRILEGHPFERVGGNAAVRVDVRVVAATNQPLEQAIAAGKFRRDLFFRLQVVELTLPPLRERKSDVPLLAEHFLKRYVRETGRKIQGFTAAAHKKMDAYHWPGNVRELRNVVERAVALGKGPMLDAKDIWLSSLDTSPGSHPGGDAYEPVDLEEVEKRHIRRTLEYTNWNKSQAATILKIERSTLDRKIKSFDLKRE